MSDSILMTHQHTLAQDALALSSDTMATLTGYRESDQAETVQAAFVAFCERHHSQYRTWQEAWRGFQASRTVKAPAPKKPAQQVLEFGFQLIY